MRRALDVAKCTPAGDVPVGAVLFDATGAELATGVNRREQRADPTAHAEVEAIRQAVRVYGDGWRLSGCELVVTLEPCAMCAGALQAAHRIDGGLRILEVIVEAAHQPLARITGDGYCEGVIFVAHTS